MNLEEKLLGAKEHCYDSIMVDTEAFKKRLFGRIPNRKSTHGKFRLNKFLIRVLTPIMCLGIVVGFDPIVRANVLLSAEQISSEVLSLNYTHPINGYVVIFGKKMTKEQYELLFAKAIWTKNGYQVTMVPHINVEQVHGSSTEYASLKLAAFAAKIPVQTPANIPPDVQKVGYYAYPGSVSIGYQYSGNRQIYMTVELKASGREILDNIQKVKTSNGWATVGEKPLLYWNNSQNKVNVEATYVLNYVDSDGIQYRIAASGFPETDVVNMMQSINVH